MEYMELKVKRHITLFAEFFSNKMCILYHYRSSFKNFVLFHVPSCHGKADSRATNLCSCVLCHLGAFIRGLYDMIQANCFFKKAIRRNSFHEGISKKPLHLKTYYTSHSFNSGWEARHSMLF